MKGDVSLPMQIGIFFLENVNVCIKANVKINEIEIKCSINFQKLLHEVNQKSCKIGLEETSSLFSCRL